MNVGWWKAVDPLRPLAIVQCSKQKLTETCAAQDLYQGDLFIKSRAFIEAHRLDWRILSAKHGLVHPLQKLAPYDLDLNKLDFKDHKAWGLGVAQQLNKLLGGHLGGHRAPVIVLAGVAYRDPVFGTAEEREKPENRRAFPFVARVQVPMEGLAIGQQKAWLLEEIEKMAAPT